MCLIELATAIEWGVLSKTFGNFHNTVIGMAVADWVRMGKGKHFALEAAPSTGDAGRQSLKSDAILTVNSSPEIVLEVEGGHCLKALAKFSLYLHPDMEGQYGKKGLCILYPYAVRGSSRKGQRHFCFQDGARILEPMDDVFERAQEVSNLAPFMLITIDKTFQSDAQLVPDIELRHGTDWHHGIVSKVSGYLFEHGHQTQDMVLWPVP